MKDRMQIDFAQKEFIFGDWGEKGQIFPSTSCMTISKKIYKVIP
jgi:hypothetical protein